MWKNRLALRVSYFSTKNSQFVDNFFEHFPIEDINLNHLKNVTLNHSIQLDPIFENPRLNLLKNSTLKEKIEFATIAEANQAMEKLYAL
jgi:hypothetical protein